MKSTSTLFVILLALSRVHADGELALIPTTEADRDLQIIPPVLCNAIERQFEEDFVVCECDRGILDLTIGYQCEFASDVCRLDTILGAYCYRPYYEGTAAIAPFQGEGFVEQTVCWNDGTLVGPLGGDILLFYDLCATVTVELGVASGAVTSAEASYGPLECSAMPCQEGRGVEILCDTWVEARCIPLQLPTRTDGPIGSIVTSIPRIITCIILGNCPDDDDGADDDQGDDALGDDALGDDALGDDDQGDDAQGDDALGDDDEGDDDEGDDDEGDDDEGDDDEGDDDEGDDDEGDDDEGDDAPGDDAPGDDDEGDDDESDSGGKKGKSGGKNSDDSGGGKKGKKGKSSGKNSSSDDSGKGKGGSHRHKMGMGKHRRLKGAY